MWAESDEPRYVIARSGSAAFSAATAAGVVGDEGVVEEGELGGWGMRRRWVARRGGCFMLID